MHGVASGRIARAIRHDALAKPGGVPGSTTARRAASWARKASSPTLARSKDAAFGINLEARGPPARRFCSRQPRAARGWCPVMAHGLPHPVTTSLFATI